MHRAPSKRRQLIQRTIVYTAMTLLVLGMVTVLVLLMLGYRFNRETNTIEQGGLVQFVTHPTGASVTVGNAHLLDTTPSKITVNPGSYLVKMERNGYRGWEKNVTVEAGKVLWLNYAQLVPEKIETADVRTYKALAQARIAPNDRYLALLTDAGSPTVNFVDMESRDYTETPAEIVSSNTSDVKWRYSIVSWSEDSNYLLMTRTHAKTTEWLLVDRRDPTKSESLSTKYKLAIATALFDPASSNRLYIRTTGGDVRQLNVSDERLSDVLLSDVSFMNAYNNVLLYVQQKSKKIQSVGYLSEGSTVGRELMQRLGQDKVLVDFGSYYGDHYAVVTTGSKAEVYRLSSLPGSSSTSAITTTLVTTFETADSPLFASIRTNGRFVVVQSPKGFTTYDLELAKLSSTDLGVKTTDRLLWLDNYHIGYVVKGQLNIIEFDGANRQEITAAAPGFDSVQSGNDKYLYSFRKTSEGMVLQRSLMILP